MDINYLAGFFDGEGSVAVIMTTRKGEDLPTGKAGNLYQAYQLVVQCTNTARSVLEEFQKRWGGHIYTQTHTPGSNRRTIHVWRVNGKRAKPFLVDISPYLFLKRKQAELAIEFVDLPRTPNPEMRHEIRQQIISLNDSPQRGYHNRKLEAKRFQALEGVS